MATAGKVIRCKAAVAWEPRKPLSIEDVDVAPAKAHEVRIKVVATSVCHTDWQCLYEAGNASNLRPFPLVLGHEGAGVVESVGAEVTKFAPGSFYSTAHKYHSFGFSSLFYSFFSLLKHFVVVFPSGDKVIPLFLPCCGKCDRCKSDKTNLCKKNWENMQAGVLADGTSRISCRGQQVYQFLGVSSFSQYTVLPDTSLAKIDAAAPLDRVCLLGCGVSTGYGAAVQTAKVENGSSCAVFGLGAVGLAAIMGCKEVMASRIIAVDINPEKFEKAKEFGATDCVNPRDHTGKTIQQVVVEMTDGGVDYALECVGSPVIMRNALESTREAGGTCVIAGWTETETMSVPVIKILMGRTLKGTYFGGWKSAEDVPKLVEKYMQKKLKLDEFITHSLPLAKINDAFQLLVNGESIRTVISLGEETDKPERTPA
uniref:Alcohol dehydrogenase 5-like n=1 Tax=Fundulus heteroclitus TaxID=8078 RepID=A0A3Q2QEJ9_FUNHE